jgi:DNA-binding protein H-NS
MRRMKFTPEIAAEMGRKSRVIVAQRRQQLEEAADIIKQLKENTPDRSAEAVASNQYVQETLTRTRIQLDRLFVLMDAETDPQKLDRLASAIARLAEQERQLSNRPLPGSLKPSQAKPRRSAEIEPEA